MHPVPREDGPTTVITLKGNLTGTWTSTLSFHSLEGGSWGVWLADVSRVFVPAILDAAIAALPAVAVAYSWDGKKWNVVRWSVPGDVPALIGCYIETQP